MSNLKKPPENGVNLSGDIILNDHGLMMACRVYCDAMGIAYRDSTNLSELLALHCKQAGIAFRGTALSGLVPSEKTEGFATILGHIIKQNTMGTRETRTMHHGAQFIRGAPQWDSISSTDLVALATALKKRMTSEPIVPSTSSSNLSADMIKELGLHFKHLPEPDFLFKAIIFATRDKIGMSANTRASDENIRFLLHEINAKLSPSERYSIQRVLTPIVDGFEFSMGPVRVTMSPVKFSTHQRSDDSLCVFKPTYYVGSHSRTGRTHVMTLTPGWDIQFIDEVQKETEAFKASGLTKIVHHTGVPLVAETIGKLSIAPASMDHTQTTNRPRG